jgi:hypothetical protein
VFSLSGNRAKPWAFTVQARDRDEAIERAI